MESTNLADRFLRLDSSRLLSLEMDDFVRNQSLELDDDDGRLVQMADSQIHRRCRVVWEISSGSHRLPPTLQTTPPPPLGTSAINQEDLEIFWFIVVVVVTNISTSRNVTSMLSFCIYITTARTCTTRLMQMNTHLTRSGCLFFFF